MSYSQERIEIQNLKCGGCSKTISKNLSAIEGVSEILVDLENSLVTVEVSDQEVLRSVLAKLKELGYPSVDDSNTILTKAKSLLSCASGKFN